MLTDDRSDAQMTRADATSHDDRVDMCIWLTKTEPMTIEHEISRDASFWKRHSPAASSMIVDITMAGAGRIARVHQWLMYMQCRSGSPIVVVVNAKNLFNE